MIKEVKRASEEDTKEGILQRTHNIYRMESFKKADFIAYMSNLYDVANADLLWKEWRKQGRITKVGKSLWKLNEA